MGYVSNRGGKGALWQRRADGISAYAVGPGDRTFVMARTKTEGLQDITLVLNFFEELRARVGR